MSSSPSAQPRNIYYYLRLALEVLQIVNGRMLLGGELWCWNGGKVEENYTYEAGRDCRFS